MSRGHPEEDLQRACVQILEQFVPPPPKGPAWTAVNPISAKSKAAAGVSKAMGLRAGWVDIDMLFKGRYIGLELKAPKGRLSVSQLDVHQQIKKAGGVVHVIRSYADLLRVLALHEIPCRVKPGQVISLP